MNTTHTVRLPRGAVRCTDAGAAGPELEARTAELSQDLEREDVARRGRRPVGAGSSGPSPKLGARVDDRTVQAVRVAAAAEDVSESEWLRRAIVERLNRGAA